MIYNYLLTTWRSIRNRPLYSLINILGLSLGIGLFILILCYIRFEYSFDKMHRHYDDLGRVELNLDGKGRYIAYSQPGMRDHLKNNFPEVIDAAGLSQTGGMDFRQGDNPTVSEGRGWWADPAFFRIFSYRLKEGDAAQALEAPFSVVLNEDLASKYFPQGPALGQVLQIGENDYTVTGIIENCPLNAQIQYRYLLSYNTYLSTNSPEYFQSWNAWQYTYVLMQPGTDLKVFNAKIKDLLREVVRPEFPSHVYVKPMADFHFNSSVLGDVGQQGDTGRVRLYSIIGLFILLIACINFMNLSTAQATLRMKEVGLRKTLGANRKDMIQQFMGESMALTYGAALLGLLWAMLGLKPLNAMMSRSIPLSALFAPMYLMQVLLFSTLTGIISGSYPALMLSAFRPAVILRNRNANQSGSGVIRKILVVFQFAISMVLILGIGGVQKQMHYMMNKDLGIHHDAVLIADFHRMDEATQTRYTTLKHQWEQLPGVKNVAFSNFTPGFNGASTVISQYEGANDGENVYIYTNRVDADFIDTYGMELIQGRNFRADNPADVASVILNEAAVKAFGWKDPLGKRIGLQYQVIGVVKDFHFASFKEAIAPMWMTPLQLRPRPGREGYSISIQLTGNLFEARQSVEAAFSEAFPSEKMEAEFFDEFIDYRYNNERTTAKTVGFFTALALFIACMGLFGLSTFTAQRRIKEIGIRKVLGASMGQLTRLLLSSYVKWIALASVLAWPVGYWGLNKWFETYHYHTNADIGLFVAATGMATLIGLVTVLQQALNTARLNPVKALKTE